MTQIIMPSEFRNAADIARALQRNRGKIAAWFAHREPDLDSIVRQSVGGNTFRAFRNMPHRPSEVFRNWALHSLTDNRRLFRLRSQAAFDRWHDAFCWSFRQEWEQRMGDTLPFGASRKLPDLLLKAYVRWTGLTDDQRSHLIPFLHVSLDSLSLRGIRNCIDDPEIPADASMGFVAGPTMYRQIQEAIRTITKQAHVPAIYYDVLVWDIRRT